MNRFDRNDSRVNREGSCDSVGSEPYSWHSERSIATTGNRKIFEISKAASKPAEEKSFLDRLRVNSEKLRFVNGLTTDDRLVRRVCERSTVRGRETSARANVGMIDSEEPDAKRAMILAGIAGNEEIGVFEISRVVNEAVRVVLRSTTEFDRTISVCKEVVLVEKS